MIIKSNKENKSIENNNKLSILIYIKRKINYSFKSKVIRDPISSTFKFIFQIHDPKSIQSIDDCYSEAEPIVIRSAHWL